MIETTHDYFAMGSDCAIRLCANERADEIALAAEAEVRRIEARYSRFREDSDLSRINRAAMAGVDIEIDPETAGLIGYAQACYAKSDGAFDISAGLLRAAWDFSRARLPDPTRLAELLARVGLDKIALTQNRLSFATPGMALDLGGLGKEYAADRAAETCQAAGVRHGFVDLGGDIRVIGPRPDGQPWRIGIRHPRNADAILTEVTLSAGAVATSGDYERYIEVGGRRYCHILDPRTGWPNPALSSVTVMADRCLVAGSLATAAMVKGAAGEAWLKSLGVRHLVVDSDGSLRDAL